MATGSPFFCRFVGKGHLRNYRLSLEFVQSRYDDEGDSFHESTELPLGDQTTFTGGTTQHDQDQDSAANSGARNAVLRLRCGHGPGNER